MTWSEIKLELWIFEVMIFYFSFVLLNAQTELYQRRLKAIFIKNVEDKK